MKILILQGKIVHYRIPVFNALAKDLTVDKLTVIHSDELPPNIPLDFEAIRLKKYSVGRFVIQPGLLSFVKEYDVVIGMFDIQWLSIVAALFYSKIFLNKGFVLWGHGVGQNKLLNGARIFLAKQASALLLYYKTSPFTDIYTEGGISESKIFNAANTVEVTNFEFNAQVKRTSFTYVGRLYPLKKIEVLIASFMLMKQIDPANATKLEIVGEGSSMNSLKDLAKGHSDILFHGEVLAENQLKTIFQRSLAYVSPGACGLGIIHSFAYGVPVITHDNEAHGPEISNLTHEKTGFLYTGDYKNLTNVLLNLSNNPEKSLQMGLTAFGFYTKHRQVSNMVKGMLEAANCAIDKK